MRVFLIGLAAAVAFAFFNGAIVYSSESPDDVQSLLFMGIFGVIPVDWALIGGWMGMAIGFAHRGVHEADTVSVFVSGAAAALFCTFLTHAVQFLSVVGYWDVNSFIKYLGMFGESWEIGAWYLWLSTPLAALTGGLTALGVSSEQRADNIRAQLPSWVSPTSRILMHVARADGKVHANEAAVITGLLRAQMLKGLSQIPKDIDKAIADVVTAEADAISSGCSLDSDLKNKCFASSFEQRESTAKLAIAVAQCDGEVADAEVQVLDKILAAWKFDLTQREHLMSDADGELERVM